MAGISHLGYYPRQLVGLLLIGLGRMVVLYQGECFAYALLVGTALMHSISATEKRGVFHSWTLLLAIFAFSLSLLGTFLVRSGVLTSVHAFAADPERGVFMLAFLALVVGGSLVLFALRGPAMHKVATYSGWSRELMLLINNVLLSFNDHDFGRYALSASC